MAGGFYTKKVSSDRNNTHTCLDRFPILFTRRCVQLFGIPHIQISLTLGLFLSQHSISCSRIFKLEFYFMKKFSWRESNSRLLIESTVSYPLDPQDKDAGRCNAGINFIHNHPPTHLRGFTPKTCSHPGAFAS